MATGGKRSVSVIRPTSSLVLVVSSGLGGEEPVGKRDSEASGLGTSPDLSITF